jgi:N-methylhydantoinase A
MKTMGPAPDWWRTDAASEDGRRIIVGVDVGGTFTDLVAVEGGNFRIMKVASTPDDPSRAVGEGVARLCESIGAQASQIAVLLHGTTVATNALLERRGATTALLTTKGFRDVLDIARQARPRLYDLDARRPEPLTPRSRRLEIDERMRADGRAVKLPNVRELEACVALLKNSNTEAIAVCFLHSYVNPEHEKAVAKAIADIWPEVSLSLSSRIIPEYREFERTSTTVANAYVAPVMSRYLTAMERRLDELAVRATLRVMQSSGGLMSVGRAAELPAATLLSGIAAGALGGVKIAYAAGKKAAISIDIGGTSCDLSLGLEGAVRAHRQCEVAGLPIRMPALDVQTIGAGGGSIAYLDGGGALSVGPRSAGASPGPACYLRGGLEPTVTDANLLLGRLPTSLLGGRLDLSTDAARTAIEALGRTICLPTEQLAAGIVRVINASMIRKMRVITVDRGVDPRGCAMVAFGGGGPVHAADLAREMGITNVIIPPTPGVTSALGLVLAGLRHDAVRTVLIEIGRSDEVRRASAAKLEAVFSTLFRQLSGELESALVVEAPFIFREVEARYRRQGHELSVVVNSDVFDLAALDRLEQAFHSAHERRFGFAARDEPILIVNAIVTLSAPGPGVPTHSPEPAAKRKAKPHRMVWFDGGWRDTPVHDRQSLERGKTYVGPLIVEQMDTTTVVPPWGSIVIDEFGNLVMELQPLMV